MLFNQRLFLLAALLVCCIFPAVAEKNDNALGNLDFEMGIKVIDKDNVEIPQWKLERYSFDKIKDLYHFDLSQSIIHSGSNSLVISGENVRLNDGFGYAAQVFEGHLTAKEFTVNGFVNIEAMEPGGWAGIFLFHFDKNDELSGFKASYVDSEKLKQWQKLTLTTNINKFAHRVELGVLLSGNGKLYFDGLSVAADGERLKEGVALKTATIPASQGSAFDKGTTIKLPEMTVQKKRELLALAKVWGFIKYYHPKVAEGLHNMDDALLTMLPEYLKATTFEQANQLLSQWIDSFGEVPNCAECFKSLEKPAAEQLDFAWFDNEKLIAKKVGAKLHHIYQNRIMPHSHFYHAQTAAYNVNLTTENAFNNVAVTDHAMALLGLFRLYNSIEYFFAYQYLMDRSWDEVMLENIDALAKIKSEQDYFKMILAMLNGTDDTHAQIVSKHEALVQLRGKNILPVIARMIEGKLVVMGYLNGDIELAKKLPKGTVISHIDGLPISAHVERLSPLLAYSNESVKQFELIKMIFRSNRQQISITSDATKGPQTFAMTSLDDIKETLSRFRQWAPDEGAYRIMENNVGYINLGAIKGVDVTKMMSELADTKGLVVDIRNYPQQFMVFSLGAYFYRKTTDFVKFSGYSLTYPGQFEWQPATSVTAQAEPFYAKPVVILVNEITQSQAEYTTMALRQAAHVTVMGSQTSGADGNVSYLELPGGVKIRFTGLGIYTPEGDETQRVGIEIDDVVKPTVAGIKHNRDELLEHAVDKILQK